MSGSQHMLACKPCKTCLVCIHFGSPLICYRARLALPAEGRRLRQTQLLTPVDGAQEGSAVGAPQRCAFVASGPHYLGHTTQPTLKKHSRVGTITKEAISAQSNPCVRVRVRVSKLLQRALTLLHVLLPRVLTLLHSLYCPEMSCRGHTAALYSFICYPPPHSTDSNKLEQGGMSMHACMSLSIIRVQHVQSQQHTSRASMPGDVG